MFRGCLFAVLILFVNVTQAAIQAEFSGSASPTSQHIIVAGTGGELDSMFLEAALGKAQVIAQRSPETRVLLFSNVNKDLAKEVALVERAGLKLLVANKDNIGIDGIVKASGSLPIASLSIYSHSAVNYGVHLFKGGRYSSKNPAWLGFKGRFTDTGYIYLYGCNTGFELAPSLSVVLSVPVAGSLTSSEFQYLDQSSKWKYSQPISDLWGPEVSENQVSVSSPLACRGGACIRMQVQYGSYSGYWGEYKTATFPAFKFFCPGVSEGQCEKVMAKSLFSQMTDTQLDLKSDLASFKIALVKFLCPRFNDTRKSDECEAKLLSIAPQGAKDSYSPATATTLHCDANGCDYEFKCKRASLFNPDQKCEIAKPAEGSTSFVDEYRRYLRGYSALM